MDKLDKNYSGIIAFILVIILICVGGYYLIKYQQDNKNNSSEYLNNSVKEDIKIDDSKEYIYFTNEEKISDNFNITYKDINININTDEAKKLQNDLNNKMDTAKSSVVKSDNDSLSDDEDDIYSANIIEYKVTSSLKYLSLDISSYSYNDDDGNGDISNTYYVFDLSSGSIIDNNDILKKFNITDQDVRTKIRAYLNTVEGADIDTILNEPYYLTIASNDRVLINLVVKTASFNYNESIEMD